jgi:hypothetical protein
MDNYAAGALGHVRILLVPIGSISKRTFDQWASEIRTIETLRLSDIPPGTKDEKGALISVCTRARTLNAPLSSLYAQPEVEGLYPSQLP